MDSWAMRLHEIGTIIAALAGVIAAASSLVNGRSIRSHNNSVDGTGAPKPAARKPSKQKDAGQQDWYKPPDLNG